MKKLTKLFAVLILTAALLSSTLFVSLPALAFTWPWQTPETVWTIEGDKVFVDDENVYLSATPHTLAGSGWVEFELTSKRYEGEIDVIWGFDTAADVKPKNPQVWAQNVAHQKERWIKVEKAGESTINNVTSYKVLTPGSIAPNIGNSNNSNLIRITVSNEYYGISSFVIAFNSYIQHTSTSATFYYNYTSDEKEYYTEYYPDFKPLNVSSLSRFSHSYLGVNDWNFIKLDAAIQSNVTYKVRVWIDVPFSGLEKFSSKYVWGVKPHDETILEAKANGHLYLLDPWLSGGWDQRVKLTIDNTDIDAPLTDFPILVYLSTSSGRNSDDVSFIFDELTADANRKKIAVTTSDEETQCYVEIEKWDDANEQAWLWVKVPSIANTTDTDLYLYYDADHADNDAYVGDTNDVVAESVWDANYVVVTHMRDNPDASHIRDSTSHDNDAVKKGANEPTILTGGQIDGAQTFDGNDYALIPDSADWSFADGEFAIEIWIKRGAINAFHMMLGQGTVAGVDQWFVRFNTDNTIRLTAASIGHLITAATLTDTAAWHHIVAQRAGDTLEIYVDTVKDENTLDATGLTMAEPTSNLALGRMGDYLYQVYKGLMDEVRISKGTGRSTAWIKASYESGRDDLLDFGGEVKLLPVVTTQAASSIEDTTATGHGTITDIGSGNVDIRGIVWDLATHGDPGDVSPAVSDYANDVAETPGPFIAEAFTRSLTGLPAGDTIYARAYAHNSSGYAYGAEVNFLTKPAAPTNVAATSGTHNDKVVITWTKSTGATDYHVWRDAVDLGAAGDVATFDDNGADAGTVTPGTATASDGTVEAHVVLSLAGEGINDGTTHTYKVVASNATGNSDDSTTDTGFRRPINITYQWQMSDADSDANYNTNIGTTDPYNATEAPADGSGRYFRCVVSATGAASQNSVADRGYRAVAPTVTVTTIACSGFDKLWAIVNGEVVDEGTATITVVGFDYGLTTAYGDSRISAGTWNTGDEFWKKLSILTPATVYHYRAKAYNGVWGYGSDMVFSTQGSATLYEHLNTGGDGDSGTIYSANWTAEQFTADATSHTVTSIRVPLKRVGTTPGNVTLSITHADSDNFSTGADLSSTVLNGNAMTTSYVWYDFDITDITLDGGSSYAIVVKALSGNATDHILWQADAGGSLANAVGSHSMNSGVDWVSDSPADYLFEIWGEAVTSIEGANVFEGYIETGDWLITLTYKNFYAPYYPDETTSEYFYLQLLDDTTVIAQVGCPAWGYRPGSIYLAKSLADTLEWGNTDYKVRLIGNFSGTPYTDYALTALDWKGTELTLLDKWVIAQANAIGTYDGTTLTVDVADEGEVLNAAGHVMFSIGIPDLNVVRPDLFEMVVRQPGYEEGEWTHVLQGATEWETKLGPQVVVMLNNAGELVGQEDGRGVGGFIFGVCFLVMVILGTAMGHMVIGMFLGYPFILSGAWFGVIDYVLLGVITFIAAIVLIYKVWLIR